MSALGARLGATFLAQLNRWINGVGPTPRPSRVRLAACGVMRCVGQWAKATPNHVVLERIQ
jgi:hypothetical protein